MTSYVFRLWLTHFIRGGLITLLPFATLTLFDTALPARSITSVIVLLVIAVGLGFCQWLLKYRADQGGEMLIQGVDFSNASPNQRTMAKVYTTDYIFATADVPWMVLILLGVYIYNPLLGTMLLISCFVVGIFSVLYRPNVSSLLLNVAPTLVLFSSALFVVRGEITVGAMLFAMLTSARLANSSYRLAICPTYVKASLSVHSSEFFASMPPVNLANYMSSNKSALRIAVASLIMCAGFAYLPIKRSVNFNGEVVKAEATSEIKATSSSVVSSVSVAVGDRVVSDQILLTTISQTESNIVLLESRMQSLEGERAKLVKLNKQGEKLRKQNISKIRKQVNRGSLAEIRLTEALLSNNEIEVRNLQSIARIDSELYSLGIDLSRYKLEAKRTEYRSSVTGKLDFMPSLKEGATIVNGETLFRIVPDGSLVIESFVPIEDRPYVTIGATVILKEQKLNNRFSEDIDGKISLVSSLKDSKKENTFKVVIVTKEPLRSGSLFSVNVSTDYVRIWRWLLNSTVFQHGVYVR